ncbi:MAG: LysM peptidoglycan-binding domain-containing protein [Treponema sp.]|nr:LysM peptidoglycan-binding domain-containing protein [Treponema sp.]
MNTKKFRKCIILAASLLIAIPFFADSTYKVEKGDTLFSISRKFQITVAELRAANNLSENDVLKAGQKLIIPEADIGTAAALSTSKTAGSTASSEMKTVVYTVQKGDTLYRIARNNGLTVPELLAINNMDSSAVIKVGQKLNVKAASSPTNSKPTINSDTVVKVTDSSLPDTRNYGSTVNADVNTKWPVSNPKITQIKGKVSGVQLSAKENESVICIHEGTVMYVGTYRGFGQVLFVQTKTGLIYAYTGMGTVKVKKGDYAMSGAEVGTAGVDPISGKPQITFMVFQNGQPIDPAKAPRN